MGERTGGTEAVMTPCTTRGKHSGLEEHRKEESVGSVCVDGDELKLEGKEGGKIGPFTGNK